MGDKIMREDWALMIAIAIVGVFVYYVIANLPMQII